VVLGVLACRVLARPEPSRTCWTRAQRTGGHGHRPRSLHGCRGPRWLQCAALPVKYGRTVDVAWRRLRSLRSSPPEFAASGPRRELFSAALEQAEQFIRAADSIGYATKPVMLYYGLSQAVQAIIAAKRDPRVDQQAATSDGTYCSNHGQITGVGDLEIRDARTQKSAPPKGGAFQLLMGVLDSPTLPASTQLRQLWISLPEGVELPPTKAGNLFGAALFERHDGNDYGKAHQATTGRVAKLAHFPSGLMPLDVADVEQRIIERYPALRNFRVMANWQGCPDVAHWVLPGNTTPLHPLATWYAVLFGLSELASYQPVGFQKSA
jgi:hypothetical protein